MAICGTNTPEWIVADMATLLLGDAVVPIDFTSSVPPPWQGIHLAALCRVF